MVNQLHVWLYRDHIADLDRDDGRLRLTYQRQDTPALSTSMSPLILQHGHAHVAPWLAGLLPDNEAVTQRWAREHQVAATPMDLLGTTIGLDCAGAVQFTPAGHSLPEKRESGVEWLGSDELGRLGEQLYSDRNQWRAARHPGRFSLAGAQTKVALRLTDGRYGVPFGDEPTNVIVKPDLDGHHDHVINEHLCLTAARMLGLSAAQTRVDRFGDRAVFVASRYDRFQHAGQLHRVHQEDLCQALGIDPGMKYQSDGGPSPKQIADWIRGAVDADAVRDALRHFALALVFNWLVVGTDAHAKNYGLLLGPDDTVRLAPLYDVGSLLPYERALDCKLAMKFGGEYRIKAITADRCLPRVAREVGVEADWLHGHALRLASALPDAIADAATRTGVAGHPMATRLQDAVAEHIARVLPSAQQHNSTINMLE